MSKLYQEIREWVEKNCFNAKHLVRSAYWAKKLDPEVDEAIIIAALTHDIDRVFPGPDEIKSPFPSGLTDKEYNNLYKKHGLRASRIVGEFLEKRGAKKKLINKVKKSVEKHEFGGTYEQNLVKDADSISFLEVNLPVFIGFIPEKRTKGEVRRKFEFMFERITLPEAKKIAKPFFKEAMAKLKKVRE